jgi:adenylosuccinate synthase
MTHQAYAVIDLGFGDSGKGTIVDYLARKTGSNLVVRFNGGAQAGHNVVTPDGRHHCFSQFGSGTFVEGVRTLLTADVAIHPLGLQKEAAHLRQIGVPDALSRLFIDERCLVITPYHQALNCLKELSRGKDAHGSCGIGYGETIAQSISPNPNAKYGTMIAWNLRHPCTNQLEEIREWLLIQADELIKPAFDHHSESDLLWTKWYSLIKDKENVDVISKMFLEIGKQLRLVGHWDKGIVSEAKTPIFEGAQGVLLDEKWGFPPYYTWSNTTGSQIHDKYGLHPGDGSITTIGVVRAFPTRHGAGPFPTEDKSLAETVRGDFNLFNQWQGNLRIGYFDHVLNRYAMQACRVSNFPISALAVTHLDKLHGWVPTWKECSMYYPNIDTITNERRLDAEKLLWAEGDIRTNMLFDAKPGYEESSSDEHNVVRRIESYAEVPVVIKSTGSTAKNKISIL